MSTLGGDLEDIEAHLKSAEASVLANVGPSPVLIEIRAALALLTRWTTPTGRARPIA